MNHNLIVFTCLTLFNCYRASKLVKGFKIDLINFKQVPAAEIASTAIMHDNVGKRRYLQGQSTSLDAAMVDRRCLSSQNIDEQKSSIAQ